MIYTLYDNTGNRYTASKEIQDLFKNKRQKEPGFILDIDTKEGRVTLPLVSIRKITSEKTTYSKYKTYEELANE